MEKLDFNKNWIYKNCRTGEEETINLPHDAMLTEERALENPGRGNSSWFSGGCYEYRKSFLAGRQTSGKCVLFEFEGIYYRSEIYINEILIKEHVNGYTSIYADITPYLIPDAENEIKVLAFNDLQPNSRWYTGSGIYRPVHMYIAEKKHILPDGVKIRTLSIDPPVIEVRVNTTENCGKTNEHEETSGTAAIEILDENEGIIAAANLNIKNTQIELTLEGAKLWSCETPNLYRCRVTYGSDRQEVTFGIRTIELSEQKGFLINKERVILRGACIHHDNGILGACGYKKADERKVRLMKENGYNAIRSAHNPCSKATLEACDRLGMLVMDEYTDMWYIKKTRYDYSEYVKDHWQQDLKDMVDKDYNHPSVILYSTGNEVAETSEKRGIEFTRQMTEYLHDLDSSRPVTCGINIFFNLLYSMGFGVYSEEKADADKKPSAVGSEFYNKLAGTFGDSFMKLGAALHGCDVRTRDAFANMDVAGYNYGILRYRHDLKKYQKRFILGSETFCKDAAHFFDLAKENKRIIGDFVWAGMDYLGEVGIGSWEYKEYAPSFSYGPGWITAGSGRVDLVGNPLAEAGYTRVAFEQTKDPVIGVRPMNHKGKHSPSAWKLSNARESWSWEGCEGKTAEIEVYAHGAYVLLYLNQKQIGKRRIGKSKRVFFRRKYQKGTLTAKVFDREGRQTGESSLTTAAQKTIISISPEDSIVRSGEILFVPIRYTDEKGIVKPLMRGLLHTDVKGGRLLALGNACPYNERGYLKNHTDTYYGEAMAVIEAGEEDAVEITVADGPLKAQAVIPCIRRQDSH